VTLPEGVTAGGTDVLVNYIADVSTLVPESEIASLPYIKFENEFLVDNEAVGEQPTSNVLDTNGNFTHNLRRAGSHIAVNVSSIAAGGGLTVSGTTITKVVDALVVVTAGSGYQVDLGSAIKSDLGVSAVPSNVKLVKLLSFERVNLNNANEVTSVDNTYDIVNYYLDDNSYDLEVALENTSLNTTTVVLPQTAGNVEARLNTGDVVRVSFYYITTSDYEQLYYSKNGTHITDKIFVDISRISLASGFKNAAGDLKGNIIITNYNQPVSNTAYSVDYDYIAPKENERITVTFNHNTLANTATYAIENVRPITADVLVKMAAAKIIDVDIRIVVLNEYLDQVETVKQDAIDAVSSFLNASSLGTTVDSSDVINHLYSVSGIDRVRILTFSVGESGNLLSVTAERNEYLDAGTVNIEVEER